MRSTTVVAAQQALYMDIKSALDSYALNCVIIQRKFFYTSNRPQKSGNFPLNKRSNAWLDFTPCFLHVDK